MEHFLDRSEVIDRWNRDHPFRLRINSGDTVTLEMHDASGGQVYPDMSAANFDKIDKMRIHSLTGPVEVAGAEPGDRLIIRILEYKHEGWAWTSIIPGMGLLPEDFPDPFLHTWKLEDSVTRSMPGLEIPLVPFCGVIGVQLAEHGEFRTRPPGINGGNMDVRHLSAGSTLHLPVATPGAGLCAGDCHAAQGDGEVSINGMEAPMTVRLKIDLVKSSPLVGPYLECPGPLDPPVIANNPHHIFVESDADIRTAAKRVVRRAIAYLSKRLGLSDEQAYVTCSVVLRLKISQLVNQPVTTVSGYLPEGIFIEAAPGILP
ncbi:MAG: acetamidase [Puniceicoccaceae bacterium]|nr:MAG: acetamidase [Puniceicoccaceae bacterium]